MKTLIKITNKFTNGILLILIGLLHTKLVVEVFFNQFSGFSEFYFFKIHNGFDDFPIVARYNYETFAIFWFFYFGIFLIPLGLLVHSIERKSQTLSHVFTISYLLFVSIGVYMIPSSGMTLIMLPHAVYMLIINFVRERKLNRNIKNLQEQ